METLLRNVRYAIRGLTRTPGFTITVVATLALGIGANTAVFSGVDAILLQPLTFPGADRLVLVTETRESAPISNTAPVRIEEWNGESTTFEAITGYYTEDVSETSGDLPQRFRLARVAPRFLDVWGAAPAIGRGFRPEESQEGAAPVVVVSHRFWQTHLAGDPNVLERQLRLGDEEFSVIGVMPESFRFPDRDIDLWAPRIYLPWMLGADSRFYLWYSGYGRLKPGVSLAQARADLAAVQARLAEQYPETDRDVGVYIEPLKETAVGGVRQSLWLLFGSVSVLLLIASTNIAALLLSRTAERRQEFAIRFSLGAPRGSVVVQTLTETAVLTVAGAALGVGVAQAGTVAFQAFVPDLPRVDEIGLDGRILLYALVTIVTVTVLCGLLPAIRSVREGSSAMVAEGRRTQVSAHHSLQWLFVGVQVALSIVLLAGAGLLIRSFMELSRVDPGFEPDRILSFRVSGAYEDFEGLASNVDAILDELRALPGVEAAATSSPVPGVLDDGSGFQFGITEFELEGRAATEPRVLSDVRVVSPSYFATMQIPLLTGELCTMQPADAPLGVMVNRAFAARYLGTSPVGRRLRGGQQEARVAGVVGDAREYALDRDPAPTVYPCRTVYANPALSFLVRTQGDPAAVAGLVREKIKELEPLRAIYDVAPLAERIGDEYAQDRLRTVLLALFAGTALSLACLGVYGTLSYVVSLRRREVGLRMALGALSSNIVAQFLLKALTVVGVACLVGLALSFAFGRALTSMLYGVSPSDPATLVAVVLLVVGVATLAAILPAVRASRIDPMQALREE